MLQFDSRGAFLPLPGLSGRYRLASLDNSRNDAKRLVQLFNHPDINCRSRAAGRKFRLDEAETIVKASEDALQALQHKTENGTSTKEEYVDPALLKCIRDSLTDELVGYITCSDYSRREVGRGAFANPPRQVSCLAYHLLPEARGQGVATEAVETFLGFIIPRNEVDEVVAWTETDNLASQAVLAKCGFERQQTVEHFEWPKGSGIMPYFYRHVLFRKPKEED